MSIALSDAELKRFTAELGPIMTPKQLRTHTQQINQMNGVDFSKINKAMEQQVIQENQILKGLLLTSITDFEKMIKDKEEEKKFFEFKISKLEEDDKRLIEYEKELFLIDKDIKELEKSIEKTKQDIENL